MLALLIIMVAIFPLFCTGVITSYALEGTQSWLVAGTSSGHHVCWDLRFMLPISTVTHPRGMFGEQSLLGECSMYYRF